MLQALLLCHSEAGGAQLQGDTAVPSPPQEPTHSAESCWSPCDAVGGTCQGHCH